MNYPTFKLTLDLSIKNKITAAEAAALSMPTVSERVDIGKLTNFLELCYSEVREQTEHRSREASIYLNHYDGYVMREALRILREDGYEVLLEESPRIVLYIIWPESP
jgi:hypothetical protein